MDSELEKITPAASNAKFGLHPDFEFLLFANTPPEIPFFGIFVWETFVQPNSTPQKSIAFHSTLESTMQWGYGDREPFFTVVMASDAKEDEWWFKSWNSSRSKNSPCRTTKRVNP
ncbi:unnamed protein product [Blepharisma stoltei]|uniref:Uncharacterized protein n=1 Tax=Blepharisma stoltei TaxID=1481888 RepID=A0AAU9K708_9CILI|nr:unnamed protein product [Blepharisma stoltei]